MAHSVYEEVSRNEIEKMLIGKECQTGKQSISSEIGRRLSQ